MKLCKCGCGQEVDKSNTWKHNHWTRGSSNPMFGRSHSNEAKEKIRKKAIIRQTGKRRVKYIKVNCTYCDEQLEIRKKAFKDNKNKRFYCNRKCADSCQSKLLKEFYSTTDGRKIARKQSNRMKGENNSNFGNNWSEEQKNDLSEKVKVAYRSGKRKSWNKGKTATEDNRIASGKRNGMYGKSPQFYLVEYNGIKLRSTWELRRAKFLDSLGLNWTYEEKRYDLEKYTYVPDFFIYDINGNLIRIEEIKGWFREEAKEKITLFKKLYPKEAKKFKLILNEKDLEIL